MSFLNEFVLLLKARYPIIYIVSNEEERLEYVIRYCIKKYLSCSYYSWDYVEGYKGNPTDNGFAAKNPLEALELIEKSAIGNPSLFVLKDYDFFLKDILITRKLKNLSRLLKTQPKNIIIISSEINIPENLTEFITVLEFPLPTYNEINDELLRLVKSLNQEIDEQLLINLTIACQGLSLERIRRVLSKVIAQKGIIDNLSANLIIEEKKQIILQTQILEFIIADKKLTDIGGLKNFKNWLKLRSQAFTPAATKYVLPYPKGLLLVGIQGTGKSLAAKIVANEWNIPLLRLDFGKLFAGLVGQSEARIRKMIKIAESLAPCVLWIDEIDKVFNSINNSSTDSGTTNRVLSTFLTWQAEKNTPVFVVATANNIEFLPPEVTRKGRFDEIFFLTLPTKEERKEIFNVHLKKVRGEKLKDFQVSLFSELTLNFSGAEIEQVVTEGMRIGFNNGREFSNADIIEAIGKIVPLAKTKNKQLMLLQEWFEAGNITSA